LYKHSTYYPFKSTSVGRGVNRLAGFRTLFNRFCTQIFFGFSKNKTNYF
jgi:hypothetical protein